MLRPGFGSIGGPLLQSILYGIIFLFCVVVCLTIRSRMLRQAVLLAASYALYISWGPWFAAVLLTSTMMNFLLGLWLHHRASALWLSVGIVLNVAILCTFKYLPEIAVQLPFASLQRFSHLALPVGLSFWTFQAISYLLDLYRGEELNPSFVEFALYMSFFPVTIAGPICRMPEMLPQFRSIETTSWNDISRGLCRIATGAFMMLLARLLGQGVWSGDGINSGFDHLTRWSGPDVWCLSFGYGMQLFFDFAGYSHIAIGAAQMLGVTIPENFARPFGSTTPSIFWTRWHMSLSSWIRDYIFLPSAVIRRALWWRYLMLVMSMVVFGMWHKATVLFIIWGSYHGVLLVLHRQIQRLRQQLGWVPPERIWAAFSWITSTSLLALGWLFFRASSLQQVREMIAAVFSASSYLSQNLSRELYGIVIVLGLGYAAVLATIDILDRYEMKEELADPLSRFLARLARNRWYWVLPLYVLALLIVFMITVAQGGSASQLMYRQF